MNKTQRTQLSGLIDKLQTFSASLDEHFETLDDEGVTALQIVDARNAATDMIGTIEGIASDVREVGQDEAEKFENMPESLQSGDGGQAMEAGAESLEDAADLLDSVVQMLESEQTDEDLAGFLIEVRDEIDEAIGAIETAAA